MFYGSITALVTPFTQNGEVDWPAFDKLVEWQIDQGTHGLVPCGTTGESPTLTHEEHHAIVKRCVEIVDKRIPVIAGSGSNSTDEALELSLRAQRDGADALLIVTPYYNKPTQEGLFQHFKKLHDETALPIIIYNIPGRCVIDMSIDTMCRLAELPRITGVKDATADLARPLELRNRLGDDFCQLSGEDATVTGFLAQGGHGCISVTSNIAPSLCAKMHEAWRNQDIPTMAKLRDQLAPVHSALFCESSPVPVKYALHKMGLCEPYVRLPLVSASTSCQKTVDDALLQAGILENTSTPLSAHG
ncbi:MAG: 4-hydroxy-tetrahydrodipicolinate synthase [Alphaproteobacteria bacterium]|nr:4-hydroxy-tetrahydrodipicolinate synthase [Alphaproteobacteria bacterium]